MQKVTKETKVTKESELKSKKITPRGCDINSNKFSDIIFGQAGQMFILALISLGLVMVSTVVLISGSFNFFSNSKYSLESVQATNLAEAAVDKAVASLNKSGSSYTGESETQLGPGSYSVTVTSKDSSTDLITATGYIPNKANSKSKKTIQIQITKGIGVSFNYGMQVGEGGINMNNGARINGSVYANGNIDTGNGATITGEVYVAGGVQPSPDQSWDCTSCTDFIFGKSVSGNSQLDTAQSFKPNIAGVLNKISLKLKKFGSPPNLTARLLGDNNGKPNKTVLASGTLYANLVTGSYGFTDISFTNPPNLDPTKTYWIMLDTCGNSTSDCSLGVNYWAWAGDNLQGYTSGAAKWSPNWNAASPTWNNPSPNLDLAFKTYMGGVPTHISMGNGSIVNGNVHANTITGGSGVTISQAAYYQNISNVTVSGTSYPNSPDPAPQVFPVSDANITEWKDQATNLGVTTGNVSGCPSQILQGKIVGNVTLGNGCTVTVKSPLWVTGNITTGNSSKFKLDSSLGTSSGVMLVEGTLDLANGCDFSGTGQAGSYFMVLSLFDSRISGNEAIDTGNSSVSGILYSPYGIVKLANGATFKEISAWKIDMGNSAILNYETGLTNLNFSSGPSGSFSVIKGTYQSK